MISHTGFWEVDADRVRGEPCDKGLCDELIKFIKEQDIREVYDFGCGPGKYVSDINKGGLIAAGFDGNPITADFENCQPLDLTGDYIFPPVDLILSLEVGEHIPVGYQYKFVWNIVNSLKDGGYLVLSWAVPGQGGYGHVNEKTNEDVIKLIGLKFNQSLTDRFRAAVSEVPWFKNTLMVFQK